jgi:hypothetical protein
MATPAIINMNNQNETPPPPLRKSPPRSASPPPDQPPCFATQHHRMIGTTREPSSSRFLFADNSGEDDESPSPIVTNSQSDVRTELSLDSMSLVNSPSTEEHNHSTRSDVASSPSFLQQTTMDQSPIVTTRGNNTADSFAGTDNVDFVADENEAASLAEARRIQREEEESVALARMLMAQEAVESYAMHADYLRNTRNEYTEEDFAALQAVMAEEDPLAEGEDGEEGQNGEEDDGHHELSYDTMLRIEEQIGDVKQERWALVAKHHIDALPQFTYDDNESSQSATPKTKIAAAAAARKREAEQNDSDIKCLVCQIPYESGETLRRLPCGHCFHSECVDQWLANKDFCPYCRQCIVVEDNDETQKS